MRDKSSSFIDNMVARWDKRVQGMIEMNISRNSGVEDRYSTVTRAGLNRFGAFQMSNVDNTDYYLWGARSGKKVGP